MKPRAAGNPGGAKPLLSFIIPTYNRKEAASRLITSIKSSTFTLGDYEIIVVDDCSADGTSECLRSRHPAIRLVRNETEKLISESRNIGIRMAKGEFLFIIDDDNVLDPMCAESLVRLMSLHPSIGVLMPAIMARFQPPVVLCTGVRRNMATSITTFLRSADVTDSGLVESLDCPNSFLVRRDVVDRNILFNSKDFPIHYEEADFGERVRRAGYSICCYPKARIWHDCWPPVQTKSPLRLKASTLHTPLRAYYSGRNRVVFHRKYSKWYEFAVFVMIFNPLFVLYSSSRIIRYSQDNAERLRLMSSFLRGVGDGLAHSFLGG